MFTKIRSLASVAPFTSLVLASVASLAACGGGESVPDGKAPEVTPADPRPTPATSRCRRCVCRPTCTRCAEKLDLVIDPNADGFSGVAEIDVKLDRPRDGVWLHASGPVESPR